jgi:hypothetical protein
MIDITKVILLVISIASFVGLILYVVKAFKGTCPEKTHYSKELSQCVQDCDPPLVNDIDGSCVCPNKTDQYVGGKCIPICPKDRPNLCAGPNQCYSDEQKMCLNDKILCNIEQVCGDNCCTPENGQPTTCSKGNIIFKSADLFYVTEVNSINITITIPTGTYSTTDSGIDSYYPKVLGEKLTSASQDTGNKYQYTCSFDGTKLVFTVLNNSGFQPTFDFGKTVDPSKFGFEFKTYSFTNGTLTSDSLIVNYCYVTECPSGQEVCGDEGCCDPDSCLTHNGVSKCCDKKFANICGTGPNATCCPKDQECCGNVCCSDGEICGEDNKCKIACLLPDKDGKKLYCDPNPKGDKEEGDFCVDDISNKYSYCGHNECIVKESEPNPPNLRGPNPPLSKIVLPVCMSSDGNLYSGNYSLNSGIKLSRDLSMNFNKDLSELCTKNDCMQLYKYHGIKNLEPIYDDLKPVGCSATFECAKILDENDKEYSNRCPFGDGSTQCVYDSNGNFTGQVCPDTTFAYYNSSGGFDGCIKGWKSVDISQGHGKKCVTVGKDDQSPDVVYSRKCVSSDTDTSICCKDECIGGFIGENCDQVISDNEQVKNLLNNMPYIVQQYSGNFENLFNALSDQKVGFFSNSPYTYILVYCINKSGGRYYNYCSNNSKNYWTDDTTIAGFYNTLGQDVGDLVYYTEGVGFWWNVDTCANPPTGSNTRYISINPDGNLRSESALGSGVKFFPNVYVLPMDQPDRAGGTYKTYKTLGVLLIYGP